jgi:hypothetical protein
MWRRKQTLAPAGILTPYRPIRRLVMILITLSRLFFTRLFFNGSTVPRVQGIPIIKAASSRSDTPHSVQLFWTSDHPDAETSTWQHTTLKTRTHTPGGIRARNPSRPYTLDRGHCNWLVKDFSIEYIVIAHIKYYNRTLAAVCLSGMFPRMGS